MSDPGQEETAPIFSAFLYPGLPPPFLFSPPPHHLGTRKTYPFFFPTETHSFPEKITRTRLFHLGRAKASPFLSKISRITFFLSDSIDFLPTAEQMHLSTEKKLLLFFFSPPPSQFADFPSTRDARPLVLEKARFFKRNPSPPSRGGG